MGKGKPAKKAASERSRRFSRTIASLRRVRGLSQAALAERSDLAWSTIARLEKGRFSPSLETLFHVADGLQVSLATIMCAYELLERDGAVELADLARRLDPADRDVALRILSVLVELLGATLAEDDA